MGDLFQEASLHIQTLETKLKHLEKEQRSLNLRIEELRLEEYTAIFRKDEAISPMRPEISPIPIETLPEAQGFLPQWKELDQFGLDWVQPTKLSPIIDEIPQLPSLAIGFVVHHVMQRVETDALIQLVQDHKSDNLIAASTRLEYRNCGRMEVVSAAFANAL